MTLPYDYTFCVSATCGKRAYCDRYGLPKTDRPLSVKDFDRERNQDGECASFITRTRPAAKLELKED